MSATALARAPTQEFAFDPADHSAIAAIAYAETGIVLPPGKASLVYGRLAPRVRATGLASVGDYIDLIGDDAEERTRALDALTTNHTSFFRESHHFDDFVTRLWPALARRLVGGGRVRLWSAACSSGEEPYSWLMAALGGDRQAAIPLLRADLRMLATDLSPTVLQTASTGSYPAETMRTVPPLLRKAWARKQDDIATIDHAVRELIAFRSLNLLEAWPIKTRFDAIFCRNVMIYFDGPTKARLQGRLANQLVEGGMLYIGHSERLDAQLTARFKCVGRTSFQKVAP